MKLLFEFPFWIVHCYFIETTDFFVFILCSAALLNSCICSNSFLFVGCGSLGYKIISSMNRYNLIFSFSTCMPFIYFSCLCAPARTLVLCWVDMVRVSCSWCFSFSLLSMMLAMAFSYMALLHQGSFPLFLVFKIFCHKRCWVLSNGFFASVEMIIFFFFILLLQHFCNVKLYQNQEARLMNAYSPLKELADQGWTVWH